MQTVRSKDVPLLSQGHEEVMERPEQEATSLKEGAYTLCDSVDGTGEHYAK